MVVVEHRRGRVWAHQVPNKGAMGKAEWVLRRVVQDSMNNGRQNVALHIKTGQELVMINLHPHTFLKQRICARALEERLKTIHITNNEQANEHKC